MNQNGTYNGLDRGINNGLYNGVDVGALNGATSGDKRLSTIKLLDSFPGAFVAYSVRKLRTGYTGNCIRVQRSSDNTQQDIGFTPSGDLDTVALIQFVGNNSTDSGSVVTWYDQSGNGINATAGALLIVENGSVVYINNKPAMGGIQRAISITGTSTFNFLHDGTPSAVFAVAYKNIFAFSEPIIVNNRGGQAKGFSLFVNNSGNVISNVTTANNTFVSQVTTTTTAASNNLYSVINNVSATNAYDRQYLYRNGLLGSLNTQTVTPVGGAATYNLGIGSDSGGTLSAWQGRFQEIIIYNTNQFSNRINIEKNINNYYKIY